MPDAIITSTESTFGTISGTFAADQSTVTGTITGIITGTLDGSVGVPGLGVPDGGTTGQVLQKATNTSYDTVWATPSGGAWGTITGTLSNQTDLQTALNLKAPLASPALTGVPTAPTAATLTSTTQLATTAFVQQELLSGTANARNLEVYVRNQTGSTIPAGSIVYINGATGNRPTITLAQANNDANSAQTFGFVKTAIANNGFGFVIVRGELENVDTSALTEGVQLYLSPTTAGTWTTSKPSAPQHLVYVGIVVRAHPTQGVILVAVQNGYELNELHDVQITSPTNGQVLKYNSSTSLWYNGLDVGIPVGGTAGQFLTKIDGTDYNTDWTTVNLSVYAVKSNNLSDLTSASTARTNLGLGTMATATAADYSTTTVANGLYYPLSTNPAGYLTSASLTGYATESWVTAGFYPLTGNPSGFITSSALTPYLTSATAASTYQTLSGMSSYLTTSTAASTYATKASPTFTGLSVFNNPGNYAISIDNSAGYYTSISSGVYSIVNAAVEVIRLSAGGIKYPDGVTQSVAYPGSTGFLLKADNLSGLANTATARTNLGLGTMAVETASNYLTTATAASTYFTIASAANKADLASPALTGTPTAPTAAAATNTTQIATTAFVTTADNLKANLASPTFTGVPAAPTATAGTNTTQIATTAFVTAAVPAIATFAESQQLTSTTKAMSPFDTITAMMTEGYRPALGMTGGSSGTGAGVNPIMPQYIGIGGPNSGVAGSCHAVTNTAGGYITGVDPVSIKFNKPIWLSGSFRINVAGDSNNDFKAYIGTSMLNGNDPTGPSIGWYRQGGASMPISLMVHNGTTLTKVASASSYGSGSTAVIRYMVYSDGAGNVTLYINGTSVATTALGPTGSTTAATAQFTASTSSTASSTARVYFDLYHPKIFIAPQ